MVYIATMESAPHAQLLEAAPTTQNVVRATNARTTTAQPAQQVIAQAATNAAQATTAARTSNVRRTLNFFNFSLHFLVRLHALRYSLINV
jgi:hypothetical protein